MSGRKTYNAYAQPGIGWIQRVPSHWQLMPLMAIAAESGVPNTGLIEQNLLSLSYGRVVRKDINTDEGLLPESFETYQIVHKDEIVFRFTDLQNDKRSLRSAIVRERGIITSAYIAVSVRGCLPAYFNYLMRAYDTSKVFYGMGGGVRQSLNFKDVKRLPILVPPIDEQRQVVEFLDHEAALIDILIEKQQLLVETLRERRAALIRTVLSRGIDADDTQLVDSGLYWIGKIPQLWRVVPTRYLCTFGTGSEDTKNAVPDGQYPLFLRAVDVARIDHYSFDGEAVMTAGDGQGGVGKVFHYFNGKFEAHQRVYVFMNFRRVLARYFYYYLSTFLKPVVLAGTAKVTMESLRRPMLADFKIPLPPIGDQQSALNYLDAQTAKIDALIAKSERLIDLSRERRSGLISAAVTGQIDVRDEVSHEGAT